MLALQVTALKRAGRAASAPDTTRVDFNLVELLDGIEDNNGPVMGRRQNPGRQLVSLHSDYDFLICGSRRAAGSG